MDQREVLSSFKLMYILTFEKCNYVAPKSKKERFLIHKVVHPHHLSDLGSFNRVERRGNMQVKKIRILKIMFRMRSP